MRMQPSDCATAPTPNAMRLLRYKYEAARRAWDRDGGPLEKTVKAGEELYFAAHFLIEALDEQLAAS